MSLNSFSFIVCCTALILVMALLQCIRRKFPTGGSKTQLLLLLAVSYGFLVRADWRFCLCILAVTIITYVCAVVYERTRHGRILFAGVTVLVLLLVYFKYTGFFVNSMRSVLGMDPIALRIILPIGMSFYIFSAIAYLVDIYRGTYEPESNILNFALYIAFFPKLTAGPIVRGKDFFPQVKQYRGITWEAFQKGIQIFVFGLFKKVVLADRLGIFVDDVFYAPTAYNTGTVILAVISYSLQIYFDFSGYSDMAIGISKIFGFDFKTNFNLPYIAQDVSEFWKRWHISLSSWFRDYLYIPLGGSKKGKVRTYINLLLVMLVSGLWHGAGWTFVLWGVLHGLASCMDKALGRHLKPLGPIVNGVITYCVVTCFWVVFRADSMETALKVWSGMLTLHTGINHPYAWSFFAIVCLAGATIYAMFYGKVIGQKDEQNKPVVNGYYPVLNLTQFWNLVVFFVFCGLTIIMGYFGNTAFIYDAF